VLVGLAVAPAARAQTMLDQEERLIELHSLLVALPALAPPGALAPGELSAGLEVVGIPTIDGTTGGKRQITASDRTRAFPRPRLAVGLPRLGPLTAFAGAAYVPPVRVNEVSSHQGALELGVAWLRGPLAVGLRAHGVYATSRSPVTETATRDTLRTVEAGVDLSAGWSLQAGPVRLVPWAAVGVTRVDGRFRVTSDGAVLTRVATLPMLSAGVQAVALRHLEAAVELLAWPGRLVHPSLRLAWRL
jgi:hypothetical protein